jgi:class 3 adenylate cyclase
MDNDLLTSELKGHRTLATVVFTDCVGFSARMSVNEDHTLDLIRRDLKLMKQVCDQYEGRVLKSTGDGLLMCFISAVKAVEYAIEIQRRLIEKSAQRPPEDSLQHRIGIHLADIFINETDVMGNGVNIAARLQTLAEPGGICISQTVYDVVKAGMTLEIRYLGPQELKNIREVVPTYKIILDASTESADPYADTLRHLEQHRDFPRIKKLLVYACHNTWESNPDRLSAMNLRDLLQGVLRLAPTPERLQHYLDSAVKTLSKPAEYGLVARTIVEEVSKLCLNLQQQAQASQPNTQSVTNAIAPLRPPTPTNLVFLYEQVAQELEQTGNQPRIKKLMYYICRRQWENDPEQLSGVRLQDLVAELYQLAPTPEQLRTTLNAFIQTLSKRAEYTLIGNAITGKFQRLYSGAKASDLTQANSPPVTMAEETVFNVPPHPPASQSEHPTAYTEIAAKLEQNPNATRIKKLILYVCRRQWESNPETLNRYSFNELLAELFDLTQTREQLELALNAVARSLNKREEYGAIARAIVYQMSPLYPDHRDPEPEPPAEAAILNEPGTTPPPVEEVASITAPPEEVESDEEEEEEEEEEDPADSNNLVDSGNLADSEEPESSDAPDPVLDGVNLENPLDNPQKTFTSLFDYRLGIMKYANPLRAKILLFSALHGDFTYGDQDWFNLKMHELDGLIRHLLKTCKFYTDLEAALYGTARRLREPEENIQTATAVIRCLRPLYLDRSVVQTIHSLTDETRIHLDDFEETTLEISPASDEDGLTCQILTPAHNPTRITEPASAKASEGTNGRE